MLIAGLAGGEEADPPRKAAAVATPATDALAYPTRGLRLARPAGWTAELRDGVIRLRSADGRVGVAVVTAPRRVTPARMERDLLRSVRRTAPRARPASRSRTTLGDTRARMAELTLKTGDGRPAQAVLLSTRSRWRSYGVTVFSASGPPLSTSPDVATVLDSFQFGEPG